MRKFLLASAATLALIGPAQATGWWYGAGALSCAEILGFFETKNEPASELVVHWMMGALSVFSIAKEVPAFPAAASNGSLRGRFIVSAVRIRCGKHPEWKLHEVLVDIVGTMGEGDEGAGLFEPYRPTPAPAKPQTPSSRGRTLYQ